MPTPMKPGAKLRAENVLLRLVADLGPDIPDEGTFFDVSAGRWRIICSIGPTGAQPAGPVEEPLSECERDCLAALQRLVERSGGRHTAKAVQAEMIAGGDRWGWATTTCALSNLVATGKLINPRDKKGYGLPHPIETPSASAE
jgi:hypothetical protein